MKLTLIAILFLLSYVFASNYTSKIVKDDKTGFSLELLFGRPSVSEVKLGDAYYNLVSIEGMTNTGTACSPSLPNVQFMIGIPKEGYKINVTFSGSGSGTLSNPIAPVPYKKYRANSKMDEDVFLPDTSIYSLEQYPAKGFYQTEITTLGNQQVLKVTVYPVLYRPLKGIYSYNTNVRVSVEFEGRTGGSVLNAGDEFVLKQCLINYETAKGFRLAPSIAKHSALFSGSPLDNKTGVFKIAIRNSSEFSIDGEGVYRLTGQDIINAGGRLANNETDEIRLYASAYGMALDQVYDTGIVDQPVLKEIPILLKDYNNNGVFDSNDEIIFYATGTTRFYPTDKNFEFQVHPYDKTNYYWLLLKNPNTSDPVKRLDTIPQAGAAHNKRVDYFTDRIHREINVKNPTDGKDAYRILWVWELLNNARTFSENMNVYMHDAIAGSGCISVQIAEIIIQKEYVQILKYNMSPNDVMLNNVICTQDMGKNGYYSFANLTPNNDNIVSIGQMNPITGQAYLDWYDFSYQRRLIFHGSPLVVYGFSGTDTLFEYAVSGSGLSDAFCLDVSDPLCPRAFSTVYRNDSLIFNSLGFFPAKDSLSRRKFCISSPLIYQNVYSLELCIRPVLDYCIRDLQNPSPSQSCDYIVVAPSAFFNAAKRLAMHRTAFDADAVKNGKVVLLEDIYDYFSAGKIDISALRNFLLFARNHWGVMYAVLMGSGQRNYKSGANYILPYEVFDNMENNLITSPMSSGSTDDFYSCSPAYSRIPGGFNLRIGRLPVNSDNEANQVVDKIIKFDIDNLTDKYWKNRAVLVADDDMQLTGLDGANQDLNHMTATEELSKDFLPSSMEKTKIYLQQYPVKSTTREKPEAEYDLVEAINRGALVTVYAGHGSCEQMADEKVFTLAKTYGLLTNTDKCGLFWAASCNVGEYDIANQGSICTRLLLAVNSGMVATIGASHLTGGRANAALMDSFFVVLFKKPNQRAVSIGDALVAAKVNNNNGNSRFYNLFGDPAQYIYPIHSTIDVDNETVTDTLKMLQKVHIGGRINDFSSGNYNGKISLRLTTPDKTVTVAYSTGKDSSSVQIISQGSNLTSIIGNIRNNAFTLDFIVPKSIPFYTNGSSLNYFAWYGNYVAEKQKAGIYFSGDAPDLNSTNGDGKGPDILIYVNSNKIPGLSFDSPPAGESFVVNRNSVINVVMDDPDGIRTNGNSVNEGLLYETVGLFDRRRMESVNSVDGRPERRYFSLDVDHELSGIMQDLTGQEYEFIVMAQDNYDNCTRKSYKVRFDSDSSLALGRNEIYNYPNPFKSTTRFIWGTTDPSDVVIKVFTQSGKLIRLLQSKGVRGPYSPGANSQWDGRDEVGHRAARGVYYYTISFNRIKVASTQSDENHYPEEKPVTGKMMLY